MKAYSEHSRYLIARSKYSAVPYSKVVESLVELAQKRISAYVCVSNIHTTMMGYFDPKYREITNQSTFSVPDGMPLRWSMCLLGASDQDRVRGPSLMRDLCASGHKHELKHFMYGSSEENLKLLEQKLREENPNITISGMESPPFRELSSEEEEAALERIRNSGANVLWVGLGAPKQERWMWRHKGKLSMPVLGVGAAFDLLSGRIDEAPRLLQWAGLEWLYRFMKEPRRLWKRYLFNNPVFMVIFFIQLMRKYFFRTSYISTWNGAN